MILLTKIAPESINETLFRSYLETKDIPDPELLIRTSGELRISNFLLYQLAYTELYFTDNLGPTLKRRSFPCHFRLSKRERRFGKLANN